MNILILGGTGAMGVHLVNFLAEQGHRVTVTSRSKRQDKPGVRYVTGNAQDLTFLQPILTADKWDAVVDFMSYSAQQFKTNCPVLLQHTAQYVFLSSSRVYANSDKPLQETDARLLDNSPDKTYLNTTEYALDKAREENFLRDSGYNNWTIVRPYITYSEQRLQLGVLEKENWLYRVLQGRKLVFSKDLLDKKTTLTHGKDVSRGIAAVLGKEDALGQTFHITSAYSVTWKEVMDCYVSVLEKHTGRKIPVYLTEKSVKLQMPDKYQLIYDRYYNRAFNTDKINRYIPVSSFTDPLEGLEGALTEFLKSPHFRCISFRLEAALDYSSGEKTPLAEITSVKDKVKYFLRRYILIPLGVNR